MRLTKAGWLLLLDNFQSWTREVKERGFKNETEREDYFLVLQFIRQHWRRLNVKTKLH